jgi:serine/threonine protein kinase
MEYCEGGSVEGAIEKRGGPLEVRESLDIILPCLDGLEYAHQAEVPHLELADGSTGAGRCLVHRDLKPANLLLGGSRETSDAKIGVAKIGDFGLAKVRTLAGLSGFTRTASGAWGTPAFMSRRQAINFKYSGPEVDVWSMAATLYYMLTGEVPRDFSGASDGFAVVRDREAIPILDRKADLPKKLAAVIDEALVETSKARFQSAAAFKTALADALG